MADKTAEHKTSKATTPKRGKAADSAALVKTPSSAAQLAQQALADLASTSPAHLIALQQTAGNRAVSRLIQTKLTVGPAGDRYEQEADRVAAQVMTMPAPVRHQPTVQRTSEEEEMQMKPLAAPLAASITPLVQRQEDEEELQAKPLVQRLGEEEEELQTKPLAERVQRDSSGAGFEVAGDFEQQLAASRGGGSPLPSEVRSFMEPRFGADFGDVRVHTGDQSAQLNRSVSAQAFTLGQDIYLGEGKEDVESAQGRQLLAHELTHVVQQGGAEVARDAIQRKDVQHSLANIVDAGINVSSDTGTKGQKGHRMDVWVEIDAGDNPSMPQSARPNSVYGLELEYWESVNVAYDDQGPAGIKPWNDIYGQKPEAGTFYTPANGCDLSWNQAVQQAQAGTLKGIKKIGFADYPGLYEKPGRSVKRTLEFRIVFSDGRQTREIYATQVLEENNGQLGYTAYKDSLGNSVETHGFGGAAVTDTNDPLISGHATRLGGASDNSAQTILGTISAGAQASISGFVEKLKTNPAGAADFIETEKITYLAKLDADKTAQASQTWDTFYSDKAKGDLQIAAGEFLIADVPGTQRKQFRVQSGGLLVAIVRGTDIVRMYYTDNTTKVVNLMPDKPSSPANNLPMRSFTEIPYNTIKEQTKIAGAMTTGKFKTAKMNTKDNAHLRGYEARGDYYIVKPDMLFSYKIKKGDRLEVDDPEIRDVSGTWIKAKFGDTRGFIRANKVSYTDGAAQPVTYLYHVYMSENLQEWAQIEQGTKTVDPVDKKRIQTAAKNDRKKFGLNSYTDAKANLGTDNMLRFDDAHLRIDIAYTHQQLAELGGLYSSLLGIGGGGGVRQAGGLLSHMDVQSGDVEERERKLIRNRAIYDNAVAAMQAYDFRTYDAAFTARTHRQIEYQLFTSTPDQVIASLLRQYEGFLLAEKHSDSASKEFLITNIDRLMAAGLDTIYIEHFRYREHQPYIDQFMASAATDPMPAMLQKLVDNLDRPIATAYPNTMKGLLEMAKRRHVRIIAMDDEAGLTNKDKTRGNSQDKAEYGEERTTKMNYIAMGRIKADEATRGGRYAVLLGAAHAHTHAGATTGKVQQGVAGLSQLLNLPTIRVTDDGSRSGLELVREDKTKRDTLAA